MTNILEEANNIIHGERNKDYGHPLDSNLRVCDLWNAFLGIRRRDGATELVEEDVAHMMILFKIARDLNLPKRDNWVDIAGYAGTLEMMDEEKKRQMKLRYSSLERTEKILQQVVEELNEEGEKNAVSKI